MEYSYSLKPTKRTVVDIPTTSRLLKELRNKNGYSVKQLQEIFGFETLVAIYAWENEKCKNIPCIENFDLLSKLYKYHVEDLYILKQVDFSNMESVIINILNDLSIVFFCSTKSENNWAFL